ncbi:metal-dependent phosphohydrolase, HD superfamily [Thermococcus cleftensis]|uniref:5'-deoxynucleotidase n=1 Tax=Thermococcus cleftensis (strain DSM 27260 / KACC 17922 / CL1) TaxID=163003 RepID=I3ZVH3_THECF|nr:HD family hydrolase [Thermococcus cleftensis]AFL95707.1 metal-dependent phosphohydrolase, HD superfamily [Thermococcus cleftensis]
MPLLDLLLEAGNLKRLPRTGWLLRGVPNPESIADHSYRVALITLFLADELKVKGVDVNVERALKMALLHDLAEARITDIPLTAQYYIDKGKAEKKAAMELFIKTPKPEEYFRLWREYEEELSLEGRLVKFADKLEMLIQACEYERAGFSNLDEFWGALDSLRESEFYEHFRELVDGLAERRKGR